MTIFDLYTLDTRNLHYTCVFRLFCMFLHFYKFTGIYCGIIYKRLKICIRC